MRHRARPSVRQSVGSYIGMGMMRAMVAALMLAACVIEQAGSKVLVRCIDGSDKPIEGADIWVWQWRRTPEGGGKLIGKRSFPSDTNGSSKTVVAMTNAGGNFDRWVHARVAGKLVGASRVAKFAGAKPTDPITMKLLPSREIRGKV